MNKVTVLYRACIAMILIGALVGSVGATVLAARLARVDAVLTKEEKADRRIVRDTSDRLIQERHYRWSIPLGAGATLAGIGVSALLILVARHPTHFRK
jgi:hypothetical protein